MKNNFFEVFKTIDQTFFFFLQYSTKSPANSRNRKIKEDRRLTWRDDMADTTHFSAQAGEQWHLKGVTQKHSI